MNLIKGIKITKDAASVSAGTEVDSTILDMSGYDGVLFVTTIGTANAGNYMKGQQDAVVGFGTVADLEGSKVVATGNGEVVFLDVYRPRERFVRCAIIRAGANTTVGEIYAIRYQSSKGPVSNATTDVIIGKTLASPAEGTA